MKVTFYGTRGSVAVSHPSKIRTGGNTTCLRIASDCLPQGFWLVVDAGTGMVPLFDDFMSEKGESLTVLQTHWHHDHTQGMPLSAFPFIKSIPVSIYGPKERGMGGRQVYEEIIMRPPVFPVDFAEIGSHFQFHDIIHPNSSVMIIHPLGGKKMMQLDAFETLEQSGAQIPFRGKNKFRLEECMVIRMFRSNHPEQTISYRFEERPTGQVFTFLTDHENQDGVPQGFQSYLKGTTVVVMDTQYTRERYDTRTAGFGHGTPDYVAKIARMMNIPFLGTTHHDPASTDEMVDAIVQSAQEAAGKNVTVFACRDYLSINIGDMESSLA